MNREEEQEAVVAALLVDVVRPLLQQLQGATANGAAARANLAQQLHEALLNDDDDAADDVIENYVYRITQGTPSLMILLEGFTWRHSSSANI
jgi:hypothetical protein